MFQSIFKKSLKKAVLWCTFMLFSAAISNFLPKTFLLSSNGSSYPPHSLVKIIKNPISKKNAYHSKSFNSI